MKIVERFASADHLLLLDALASDELLPADIRKRAQVLAARIRIR